MAWTNPVSIGDPTKKSHYDYVFDRISPQNFIGYITGGIAPDEWSEYTAARGRLIVGLPSGGTDEGTVGTLLTDLQDKTHTHTGPSHVHNMANSGTDGNNGTLAHDTRSSAIDGTTQLFADSAPNAGGAYHLLAGVQSQGTGATGTAALSAFLAYIQLMAIKKD